MNRDEMIEVAARAECEAHNVVWANLRARDVADYKHDGGIIIDALIAAGVIPDPETTVVGRRFTDQELSCLWETISLAQSHSFQVRGSDRLGSDRMDKAIQGVRVIATGDLDAIPETTTTEPVPYVAIGNGEPVPPALQALYDGIEKPKLKPDYSYFDGGDPEIPGTT